jgi:hypothetical protein
MDKIVTISSAEARIIAGEALVQAVRLGLESGCFAALGRDGRKAVLTLGDVTGLVTERAESLAETVLACGFYTRESKDEGANGVGFSIFHARETMDRSLGAVAWAGEGDSEKACTVCRNAVSAVGLFTADL